MNENNVVAEDTLHVTVQNKLKLRERIRVLFGAQLVNKLSCRISAIDQGTKVSLEFGQPTLESFIVKAGK
jgi:hypothetical protein